MRALTAAVQVFWALVLFEAAAWLVCWGDFDWFVDMIGAAIAWVGLNVLRGGCEEFVLNRNSADFGVIGTSRQAPSLAPAASPED